MQKKFNIFTLKKKKSKQSKDEQKNQRVSKETSSAATFSHGRTIVLSDFIA